MHRIRMFAALAILTGLAACSAAQTGSSKDDNGYEPPPPPGGHEPGASPLGAPYVKDCLWVLRSESNLVNTLFPDKHAAYWLALLPIPPGGEVRIRGQYPHARYMSFNLYNPRLEPIDALADAEIVPDAGSLNAFIPGALRAAQPRDYTVRMVAGVPPERREPNTFYAFQMVGEEPVPVNVAAVFYRVYVADTKTDKAGGVDLPRFSFVTSDGSELSGAEACAYTETNLPPTLNDRLASGEPWLDQPPSTAALPDLRWRKFFDTPSSLAHRFDATPLGVIADHVPWREAGGFASNLHNSYAVITLSQQYGPLVAFGAKFPSHPATVRGDALMGDGLLRYFSICTNEFHSQRYYDCLYDEQVRLDRNGMGIVMIGRESDRPSNATYACGVSWLNWGTTAETLILYRQMLPKPQGEFPEAIKYIPGPPLAHEEEVMGPYYPRGGYFTREKFEALGCPVSPTALAS